MQRRRLPALLGGILLATVLAVQPAAAFTDLQHSGRYYVPEVMDDAGIPGVVCQYKDNPGPSNDRLERIKVKQFFTHAPYHHNAKVGFVLVIKRNAPPFGDGVFKPYAKVPIATGTANDQHVAFLTASWTVPSGVAGQWRAFIRLVFYKPGGNVVGGSYLGRLDAYQHKLGAVSYVDGDVGMPGACAPTYAPL